MMNKHSGNRRIGSAARTDYAKKPARFQQRRLRFESLEHRRLLSSVGLNTISNVTLPAGTSIMVALNGSDPTSGKTVNFGVTTSNPAKVTPIVMPQTNPSLQFNISGLGTMTFQLFDNLTPNTVSRIETLVNGNVYNGDYIYRAETGSFALVQGGNNPPQINSGANVNTLPTGLTSTTINEEFNPDLNYTSAGALAMARTSSANSSGTEFFITDGATRSLDYAYSLFGFQTGQPGDHLQRPIDHRSRGARFDGNDGELFGHQLPEHSGQDHLGQHHHRHAERRLDAPGADGRHGQLHRDRDRLRRRHEHAHHADVHGERRRPTRPRAVANPWASKTPVGADFDRLPAAVRPRDDHGVTSANNSSTSKELQFLVSGVTVGDQVTVYADGVAIGSATATSTSTVGYHQRHHRRSWTARIPSRPRRPR